MTAEQKRMELDVSEFQTGKITWNYEELKNALDAGLKNYAGVVYDESQIAEAKADRAKLNALEKALTAERLRLKKEFLTPFDDFENKCKELACKVKNVSSEIDAQIKKYEEAEKKKKREHLLAVWEKETSGIYTGGIDISPVWDDRWLNKTFKLPDAEKAVKDAAARVRLEIKQITTFDTAKADYMIPLYLRTLNFAQALAAWEDNLEALRRAEAIRLENERRQKEREERAAEIARRQAEAAAAVQNGTAVIEETPRRPAYMSQTLNEPVKAPKPATLHRNFWVEGTEAQIIALGDWLKANNMKFGKLGG